MFGFEKKAVEVIQSTVAKIEKKDSFIIHVAEDAEHELSRILEGMTRAMNEHLNAASIQRDVASKATKLADAAEAEAAKVKVGIDKLTAAFGAAILPPPIVVTPTVTPEEAQKLAKAAEDAKAAADAAAQAANVAIANAQAATAAVKG